MKGRLVALMLGVVLALCSVARATDVENTALVPRDADVTVAWGQSQANRRTTTTTMTATLTNTTTSAIAGDIYLGIAAITPSTAATVLNATDRSTDGTPLFRLGGTSLAAGASAQVWVEFRTPTFARFSLSTHVFVVDGHSGYIGPEGGVIAINEDGAALSGFELRVPPGALAAPVVITARDVANPGSVQPAVELGPSGLHFLVPATVTMPYVSDGHFPELFERSVEAFSYESLPGERERLRTLDVDTTASLVTSEIWHFSIVTTDGDVVWRESSRLGVPAPAPGSRAVLLVHGITLFDELWGPGDARGDCVDTFGNLRTLLLDEGYDVFSFDYDGDRNIWQSSRNLVDALRYIRSPLAGGHDGVSIVCHSMGGLVARAYIQNFARATQGGPTVAYGGEIDVLVSLATPHHGSDHWMLQVLALQTEELAARDMIPEGAYSDFLSRLNAPSSGHDLNPSVRYVAVAARMWDNSTAVGGFLEADPVVTTASARLSEWEGRSGYAVAYREILDACHIAVPILFTGSPVAQIDDIDHPSWPIIRDALKPLAPPDTTSGDFSDDFSTNPSTNGKWKNLLRQAGDPSSELSWDPANWWLYLTRAVQGRGGFLWANYSLTTTHWTAEFDFKAGGGTGADGFFFAFYSAPDSGNLLGYYVNFDNFQNSWDPSGNFIGLFSRLASPSPLGNTRLQYANDPRTEDNAWHHAKVDFDTGRVRVYIDDMTRVVLDHTIANMDYSRDGIEFGGQSGGLTNNHIIDNVVIKTRSGDTAAGMSDDFESYSSGSWPQTWAADANALNDPARNRVANSTSHGGSRSLQLFGQLAGNWASLAYRPVGIAPPYDIQMYVKNGSESLSGAHPHRASIGLRQGTSWTNPFRQFMTFKGNGTVVDGADRTIGTYSVQQWIKVRIRYERPSTSTVSVTIWMNDVSLGTQVYQATAAEATLTNLDLAAQEGSVWFDDIEVTR